MLKEYTTIFVMLLAGTLAVLAGMGAAIAQSTGPVVVEEVDAVEAVQAAEAAQVQLIEVQRARTEMNTARRQLEEAARTIAAQVQVMPELDNLRFELSNFSGFANRAQIGATIVDADDGALVTAVSGGSGADTAGLRIGDVIQSIDGIDVDSGDDSPTDRVMARLEEIGAGDTVSVVVERAGDTLDFDIETIAGSVWATSFPRSARNVNRFIGRGDRSGVANFVASSAPDGSGPNIGAYRSLQFAYSPWGAMELVAVTEELGRYFNTSEGLLVISRPRDDTLDLHIQDGDVILEINGRTPNSPEHAIRILSSFDSGETVEFSIMRDRRRETIDYEIPNGRNAAPTFPTAE